MKKHEYKGFVFEYTYDDDHDCLEVYHNGVELGTWAAIDRPVGQVEDIADVFLAGVNHANKAALDMLEALEGLILDISINHSISLANMVGGSTREALNEAFRAIAKAKGENK